MAASFRAKDKDGNVGFVHTINGEQRFVADEVDPASEVGAMSAALISAGRAANEIPTRLGAIAGSDRAQQELDQTDALFQSLEDAHPIATAVGESIPGFAVPGGKLVQIGVGAVEGALASTENPLQGAAMGAGFGLVGQKAGDELSQMVQRKIRKFRGGAANAANQQAIDELARIEPNPLRQSTTIGERTGSLPAQIAERARSTALGSQALIARRTQNLNRQFGRAIGEETNKLTPPVLGQASDKIGRKFEAVADGVDVIPLTQDFSDALGAIKVNAGEVVPNARSLKQLELIEDLAAGDKITGKQYLRLRTRLGKISRTEWATGGDAISGEFVDDMITALDDMLAEAAPELGEALGPARQQWRILTAMRRGSSISPQGDVNPNAMQRSMESSFRTLDRGKFAKGAIGDAQRANLAAQQFPAEGSSRTAERTASLNPLKQAQAGLLNMGGGAGGQVGGGTGRALSLEAIEAMESGPSQ